MLFDTDLVTYRGLYKTIQTDKLNIPAIDGRRTILSNHMPVMIPLDNGVIETNNEGTLTHYVVSEGMLYFENNKATIVCDVIEDINDVDIKFYEEKLQKAKNRIENARSDFDVRKATVQLARATNIINSTKKARS